MASINVFKGGEGGVAAAFGANAWAMYPRPDVNPATEYKGPAHGGNPGKVTWRIAAHPMGKLMSDSGGDALMRYLKSLTLAQGDELRVIVVPRQWKLNAISYQVRVSTETSGTQIGGADGAATGVTGELEVGIVTPASTTLGVVAAYDQVVAAVDLSATALANVAVAANQQISEGNRYVVLRVSTAPSSVGLMNFEVTADMEPIGDMGR